MKNLLNAYEMTSAATAYIIGFLMNNKVYEIILDHLPEWLIGMDRESTSHGGARKLRIRMTATAKARLKAAGAAYIGTAEEVLASRKNKGEAFEKFITERAGQEWHKDSVPYFIDGDLTVNGTKYQIKFESASLANENTIRKALEATH
jgi:hypothetical protein